MFSPKQHQASHSYEQSYGVVPDNFHKFSSLPAEIRAMIWEYSLPDARVFEVMDVPHAKKKMDASSGLMFANVHREPPPALASVSQESRYFVLRHYKPLTLGITTKYVDLSRDMLLLEPYLLLKRLHRTVQFMSRIPLIRDHLACLALGTSYGTYTGICHPMLSWKVSKSNMAKLLTSLAKFSKLKTLMFVVHQEFQFEFDFRYPPGLPVQHHHPGYEHVMTSLPPHSSSFPVPSTMLPQQHHYVPSPPRNLPRATIAIPPSPGPSLLTSPMPPHMMAQGYRGIPSQLPLPAPLSPPEMHPRIAHRGPIYPGALPPISPSGPVVSQTLRPQLVHQAYRFKFDIEANINCYPRRPHLNELLFYPLADNREEDKDDWEALLNNSTNGNGGLISGMNGFGSTNGAASSIGTGMDGEDEEDIEWCDPWPTNDDWRRFRRRFQRSVIATLQNGLAGSGHNEFCVEGVDKKQQRCGGNFGYSKPQTYNNRNSFYSLHDSSISSMNNNTNRRRYSLRHSLPAIKGASLLWRYTRGD